MAQGREIEASEPAGHQGAAAHSVLRKIEDGVFQAAGIRDLAAIDLIACRVVHGALRFREPRVVEMETVRAIEELDDLAPLHNAQSVSIIRACLDLEPKIPVVAVFDSAFHATLPEIAYRYAIDYEPASRRGIRRYGFHGISHRYLMLRYAEIHSVAPEDVNLITLHLEGGCSATAIRRGKSVDTSMGFTPLEGLMMSTRCGDLDPSIIGYLERTEQMDPPAIEELLNKKSGLLGVSGTSPDTRVLIKNADARSRLALDMFAYRVCKYIGAYMAVLGEVSAVIFGGGISENTPEVREKICSGLGPCGCTWTTVKKESRTRIAVCTPG